MAEGRDPQAEEHTPGWQVVETRRRDGPWPRVIAGERWSFAHSEND